MVDMCPGQRMRLPESSEYGVRLNAKGKAKRAVRSALVGLANGKLGAQPPLGLVFPGVADSILKGVSARDNDGYRYSLRASALSGRCEHVVIAVWICENERKLAHHLAELQELSLIITDARGTVAAKFAIPLDTLGREAAVLMGELYYKGGWRFKADGSGFLGGLPSMANRMAIPSNAVSQMDRSTDSSDLRGPSPAIDRPPAPSEPHSGTPPPLEMDAQVLLPRNWPGKQTPRIPTGLLDAVARVLVQGHDGALSTGTAFAVTPGGCLLTCHHVIENAASIHVQFHGRNRTRRVVVLAADPKPDLALLRVADSWGVEDWLRLRATSTPQELGTDVGLVSYPLGRDIGVEISYSKGSINSVRTVNQLRLLQVDAGAAPGSSGGPLFRQEDGEVIGVLSRGLSGPSLAGMHANFAVDVYEMVKLGWVESG